MWDTSPQFFLIPQNLSQWQRSTCTVEYSWNKEWYSRGGYPGGRVKRFRIKKPKPYTVFLQKLQDLWSLFKQLSILPPTVKKTFPVDIPSSNHIRTIYISKSGSPESIQICDPDFDWTPWANPIETGKLYDPIKVSTKSRGSSRQRWREFSKLVMNATVEDRRKIQEYHSALWQRDPSPDGPRVTVIEYRYWPHYLDETVSVWTTPSRISSFGPKTSWYDQKIEIPHQMGSWYTCRVGNSRSYRPEPITVTTQLVDKLKEESGRVNLVLP